MQTYLFLHEVDDALFPELGRAPGVYGIEAALVKPGADPRIPVPEDSAAALLVSYALLAAEIPAGAGWQLEIGGVHAVGKPREAMFALIAPAPKIDNVARVERPHPATLPEGTIFRAVFWVDPSPFLRDRTILLGDTLTLRHGNASAHIVRPVAGARPVR